ncbi:HAD family phosphatase [Nocardia puris]|uniref:HAD family hydrolase n=1 Tax=Nocardia puris TaxID=208602 RepID=UPI001893317B|nr:HAD family hydrolase [Nocardia puris]MBF6212088.1 HAD family phosphatase [Nocardia puris]MBF6367114.1 HAD family phosphatase [Nocardia puris]MBF6461909.1 HAD family phosphatase [Nocardia puris]
MVVRGGRPRLIALDVDGTLLDAGVPVSERVVAAVRAAVAQGAHVVVTTGRSLLATRPVLAELGLVDGHALCSNGAVHIDVRRSAPVAVHAFDPAPAVATLRDLFPEMVFAVEKVGVGTWATGASPGGYPIGDYLLVDHDALGSEPTPRLNCWWPDGSLEEMLPLLESWESPESSWVHGDLGPWLTVSPRGVSKGWALERLRRALDIPRAETLAIGDGYNDREMLTWAGHSVTMANAPAEIQDLADEITTDVTTDGAARILERWF